MDYMPEKDADIESRRAGRPKTEICDKCGVQFAMPAFWPTWNDQMGLEFCSTECRNDYYLKSVKPQQDAERAARTCSHCGGSGFEPEAQKPRYGSDYSF